MNQNVIDSLREIVFAHRGYPSDYLGLHARRLREVLCNLDTCDVAIAIYKRGKADDEHGPYLFECNIFMPGERLTLFFDFDLKDRAFAAFDAIVPASTAEKLRLREHPVLRKPIPEEDLEAFVL